MTSNSLNKKILAILIITVIVVSASLLIFSQLSESPVAKIDPPAPSYIANSKIFLLSASSNYGYYDANHCFIAHLTVRNDYTTQNPVDNETGSFKGNSWFIILAKLYDKNGNLIDSHELVPVNQHPNYNQQNLTSGENVSFSVYMATSSRAVDHYTLVFGYLGSIPVP